MNTKTGIRYGIISVNEIDSDFLADFEAIYPKVDCDNCGMTLTSDYCEYCESDQSDAWDNLEPLGYLYNKNGLHAEYYPDSGYVMVFKSRSIFKRALCSPCYPNAGDLSTPGNYKTYGIPTKYLSE